MRNIQPVQFSGIAELQLFGEEKTERINFNPIMVSNLSELIVDQQRSEVKKEEV